VLFWASSLKFRSVVRACVSVYVSCTLYIVSCALCSRVMSLDDVFCLILDFVSIYSEVRICNYLFLNCEFHGIMWLCCSFVCTVILGHIWFSFSASILSKGCQGPCVWRQSSHTAKLTIQFFCSWSLEHFQPGSPPAPILLKHNFFKLQEILWTPIS